MFIFYNRCCFPNHQMCTFSEIISKFPARNKINTDFLLRKIFKNTFILKILLLYREETLFRAAQKYFWPITKPQLACGPGQPSRLIDVWLALIVIQQPPSFLCCSKFSQWVRLQFNWTSQSQSVQTYFSKELQLYKHKTINSFPFYRASYSIHQRTDYS